MRVWFSLSHPKGDWTCASSRPRWRASAGSRGRFPARLRIEFERRLAPFARHVVRCYKDLARRKATDRRLWMACEQIAEDFVFCGLHKWHKAVAPDPGDELRASVPRLTHSNTAYDELAERQDLAIA